MNKNYLIISQSGKGRYSTSVKGYEIVDNTPIFIGELGCESSFETCLGFLKKIVKNSGSEIDIVQAWMDKQIKIHEIRL